MGNTLLAHALFSSHQIQIDPEELFSDRADVHSIVNLNQSSLVAWHEREMPTNPSPDIILTIICQQWDEVLRKKLSYEKWIKYYPTETTLDKFYKKPDLTQLTPLELLTIIYCDELNSADLDGIDGKTITLTQYLEYQIDPLRTAIVNLGWAWDEDRSKKFHEIVLEKNQQYINWLEHIKAITNATLSGIVIKVESLEFWEKATVIAMCCYLRKINPSNLQWDNQQYLHSNNISLINDLT